MTLVREGMMGVDVRTLFIREDAISGASIIRGTNQLLNQSIIIGITMKKIMTNAWTVTITL